MIKTPEILRTPKFLKTPYHPLQYIYYLPLSAIYHSLFSTPLPLKIMTLVVEVLESINEGQAD